jgi:hypothetical protein
VIDAVARGDEATLRALLHPYLRWTDATGATVRGRRNVLALLAGRTAVGAPASCALRDGQVYRWREAP